MSFSAPPATSSPSKDFPKKVAHPRPFKTLGRTLAGGLACKVYTVQASRPWGSKNATSEIVSRMEKDPFREFPKAPSPEDTSSSSTSLVRRNPARRVREYDARYILYKRPHCRLGTSVRGQDRMNHSPDNSLASERETGRRVTTCHHIGQAPRRHLISRKSNRKSQNTRR